jgi:hypothetical protein
MESGGQVIVLEQTELDLVIQKLRNAAQMAVDEQIGRLRQELRHEIAEIHALHKKPVRIYITADGVTVDGGDVVIDAEKVATQTSGK